MKNFILLSIAIVAITFSSCQKEPEACFNSSSTSIETGTPVFFFNCTENGDSYVWNFGDNSTSNLEAPSHIYNSPGTYLVSLTAYSKNEKKKNSITNFITVTPSTPQPPTSTPLTQDIYSFGTLFSSTDTLWYSFNVINGVTYFLSWDDSYDGSGAYTADIKVTVFKSDLTTSYLYNVDSGYTLNKYFTASETGIVYVMVTPWGSGSNNLGTFALRYYN